MTPIRIVFEFAKVVVCGTHRLSGSLQFCESLGAQPPRALCLRR